VKIGAEEGSLKLIIAFVVPVSKIAGVAHFMANTRMKDDLE
jgi:hypothetical protein